MAPEATLDTLWIRGCPLTAQDTVTGSCISRWVKLIAMLTQPLEAALFLIQAVSALRQTTSQRRHCAEAMVVGSGYSPPTPGTRAKPGNADGPQSIPLSGFAPVASNTNLVATARTQKKSVLANGEAPQAVKADLA